MKRKAKPEPEDPRPRFFPVDSDHPFEVVLADIKARSSELYWTKLHAAPRPGVTWEFEVQYKKPYLGQQELM